MTKIELELDELDAKKVEKLKKELGEEETQTMLSEQLTNAVRSMYDQRSQLKQRLEQQQ